MSRKNLINVRAFGQNVDLSAAVRKIRAREFDRLQDTEIEALCDAVEKLLAGVPRGDILRTRGRPPGAATRILDRDMEKMAAEVANGETLARVARRWADSLSTTERTLKRKLDSFIRWKRGEYDDDY